MKRSQRLAPILDLAERKERAAAEAFAQQLKKVQSLRQGGDNLRGFLDGYHDRYRRVGAGGLTVKQLTEYRTFLAKINGAVEEQDAALRGAEQELELRRQAWDEARRHREGLVKLRQQALQEEGKLALKREQAELDERSARKAAKGSGYFD